jgi:hypothetical protein
MAQDGSFSYFLLNSWSTGTDWIGGCVDPTGSVEVYRRDLRPKIPAPIQVTGDYWLVTSDYAILAYNIILWWL